MSRICTLVLFVAAVILGACSGPTAPAPAASPALQGPSFNTDTTSDTAFTGYQVGNG